jgi:Asp-tRNA(Asn)/Glu-tRNA(Gln) amidotransferase A subunit family amidase
VATPLCGEEALALHKTISEFEGYRSLRRLGMQRLDLLGDKMAEFIRDAALVSEVEYESALARRGELLAELDAQLAGLDALVTVPAAGEAPLAGDNGDPRFCTRWSLAGTPAVCLPAGFGPAGLPMGIQLIGPRGSDAALLRLASGVEDVLRFAQNYERLDADIGNRAP